MSAGESTPTLHEPASRREFLSRAARGSLALAAFPALDAGLRPAPLEAAPLRADEAYWRQVQAQFTLREGVVPLNAANLCPAPRAVTEAVERAMRDIEGDVSFQNRDKYTAAQEGVRKKLAAHLGVSEDEIAIVRNTSEGNNIVVAGLPLREGDEVLLFDENHPTNNVSWEVRGARSGVTVKRVSLGGVPSSAEQVIDLFRRSIGPRTRVVSFSHVSNSSGVRVPAKEVCRLARERGIYSHVDGAQTFGALQVNLRDMGCDSYTASAHKWPLGPKEVGVLYVRAERVAEIWPNVVGVGWGNDAETDARGARKLETLGQRNDATVSAFGEALDFRERVGGARIEARILELAGVLKEGLGRIRGARMATPTTPEVSAGVVAVRFEGADMRKVYQSLYQEHGIAGAPTGGLRLCPHVYNTRADVDRAVATVDRLVRMT